MYIEWIRHERLLDLPMLRLLFRFHPISHYLVLLVEPNASHPELESLKSMPLNLTHFAY